LKAVTVRDAAHGRCPSTHCPDCKCSLTFPLGDKRHGERTHRPDGSKTARCRICGGLCSDD